VIAGILLLIERANSVARPGRLFNGTQPGFATEIVRPGPKSGNSIQFSAANGETCQFFAPDYAVVRAAILHGKAISARCVQNSIFSGWAAVEITVDGTEVLPGSEAAAYVRRDDFIGYLGIAFCLSYAGLLLVRR